jgi:Thiamine biosynthesis ATP pyrophosphatase
MDVVVAGYADLSVKSSAVRRRMIDQLASVIRGVVPDSAKVEAGFDRLVITTSTPESMLPVVTTTPGIAHALAATKVPATVSAICAGARMAAEDHTTGDSFAVSVHRGDVCSDVPSSQQLKRAVGTAVQAATGAPVDLDAADRRYHIDLRGQTAFVGTDRQRGVGGLPPGVQAPVVALVSGGIDSPVAMWRMLRRGAPVIPVHCQLSGGDEPEASMRAEECVERLNSRVGHVARAMRSVDLTAVVELLCSETADLRMLHIHRSLLLAARAVMDATDAVGIVTGDVIGQKASQTSRNLLVVDAAIEAPVYRPLIGLDKATIEEEARSLGTYRLALGPSGCEAVAPAHPETAADLEAVIADEPPTLSGTLRRALDDIT